jgi:predicted secreted protein with PEFG-CTERM motif
MGIWGLDILIIISVSLATIPVFAQSEFNSTTLRGLYENKAYDFSFEIPNNWKYLEDYQAPDGTIFQVLMHPEKYNLLFHIDTPLIVVGFENISESKVSNMNTQTLKEYVLDQIRDIPTARIVSSDSLSTDWGWIVTTEFRITQMGNLYLQVDKTYIFNDRESYNVAYVAVERDNFDTYYPVYENVIDTLVIKGVVVPEFHEIAVMVLGGAIIFAVILSRKFLQKQDEKG